MKALPTPPQRNPEPLHNKVTNHSPDPAHTQQILARFRTLLNPATTRDFHRMLIWLLAAARGSGPAPILALQGPAASGKSTATHFLRQLLDPSQGPHADHTARNRDLFEHALRNWIVAFESVRRLSPRVADFINSLAGGVTAHVRQPHDPHDPAAIFLQRPIIMNLQPAKPSESKDKDPLAAHGDSLPARTLRANLAPLSKEQRLGTDQLSDEFKELQPELLALLCTAVSVALKNLADVNPAYLPPLADAALWAIAAAPALGLTEEEILDAFEMEPDPDEPPNLAQQVEDFMQDKEAWTGTATDLLNALPGGIGPKTPKLLSDQLRRSIDELAALGLTIDFKRTKCERTITITRLTTGDAELKPSASPINLEPLTPTNPAIYQNHTNLHKNEAAASPVAHALVRAASPLLAAPGIQAMPFTHPQHSNPLNETGMYPGRVGDVTLMTTEGIGRRDFLKTIADGSRI